MMRRGFRLATIGAALAVGGSSSAGLAAQQNVRVGELTVRQGEVPRRLAGYGLVVGLDGTGDRSFGGFNGATMTVRSVVNLLRRFNIEVPGEQLRLRNVAAVLVTAEVSPYLRPGGRFEVQVGALGDATSLRGGVLWITPLLVDPNQPPVATAQGPLVVATDGSGRVSSRQGNAGRIAEGGVIEVDLPLPTLGPAPRLALRHPDLRTASRITAAIVAAAGPGTARTEDAGSILLNPGPEHADSLPQWLAALDTLTVTVADVARIVIDGRDGTVVVGGDVRLGQATVSHRGFTVRIGPEPGAPGPEAGGGLVEARSGASVQQLVAGLHAAGARAPEVAAIFEALRTAGAVRAEVVVR